jgi:F420-non-reducing hydrogenase small subunit
MMSKPKVAFYWCTSCGGCEEAVIDLNEDLLKIADNIDIVLWPVAFDFKKRDVESLENNEIAVSFINGAIRFDDQEEMVNLLRQKSRLVIAFGACAHMGGIPGMGNFYVKDAFLQRIYKEVPTIENPEEIIPQEYVAVDSTEVTLPKFNDTIKTLGQTVPVDYYLPGCPPPTDLILRALNNILGGKLPERGAVLAPNETLCDTCSRAEERPEKMSIEEIRRPHEINLSPWKCFLEQGLICLGPSTRSGCGERCIEVNMPCRGCMGPLDGVEDHGIDALIKIATLWGLERNGKVPEIKLKELVARIIDPEGTFYRFGLPGSPKKKNKLWEEGVE